MLNIVKLGIIALSICLFLSGCKKAPTNGTNEQSSSHTPMPPEQLWADYTASSGTDDPIFEGDEKHITREITAKCVIEPSETRTIKFDLDIPETPKLTTNNYDFPQGGQYDILDIMSVFFGERAEVFAQPDGEFLYKNSIDVYDNSLAGLNTATGELYLVDRNAAAMDFSSNNMLKSADEMAIDLNENEAIALCDKFLSDCGITGYKYDYTLYYGAVQSTFYSICYYYELDSLPASSSISNGKGFCNLIFFVDNNGIVKVNGSLFDKSSFNRKESINAAKIITPNDAINYVAKQAAVIRCGNESPEFNKYHSNHGEGLLYLPIREMKLGYWFSKDIGIRLSWIFFIGDNEAIEKSASFAIDAVSGMVYNY